MAFVIIQHIMCIYWCNTLYMVLEPKVDVLEDLKPKGLCHLRNFNSRAFGNLGKSKAKTTI
jgi:hypothetical protein